MLTFHYADGSSQTDDVAIHSWAFPSDSRYAKAGPRTEDTYRLAWRKTTSEGQEAGVYVTGINNPHPDRELAAIELGAGGARSRWLILAITTSNAPVFFAPYDDLSTGIPDGWNGSILFALFEGLAGIKDQGSAFSKTALTPRWLAADVPSAEITARYPASLGYCTYKYKTEKTRLLLEFTGSAETFEVQILLPPKQKASSILLDGHKVNATSRTVEQSTYLVISKVPAGIHNVEVNLT